MNNQGKNNFKGLDFQTQMALIEFLEYVLHRSDFLYVHLEDPEWKDFTLYFQDGTKIICEVKYRSKPISLGLVLDILKDIDKNKLEKEDKIKIITTKTKRSLSDFIERIQNQIALKLDEELKQRIKEKNISEDLLDLLLKTEIKQKEMGDEEIYYSEAKRLLNDTLSFWIPEWKLEQLLNQMLYREIFQKSIKGAEFSRKEYFNKIEEFKKNEIKFVGRYDDEHRKLEEQIFEVLMLVENNKPRDITDADILAITAKPQLGFLMIEKIKEKEKINLTDWNKILESFLKYNYCFTIFDILEKQSLFSEENAKYFINFFLKHYNDFVGYFRDGLIQEQGLRILGKILNRYPNQVDIVFDFVKEILALRKEEYKKFETKKEHSEEKNLISELLEKIFQIYKENKKDKQIKEIIKVIDNYFNLVGDDGKYSMYTPNNIFRILKDYIGINFENYFQETINLFIKHYSQQWRNKKGNSIYTGWELMGGITSFWGHDYKVYDRHFISFVLKPTFEEYYRKNSPKAWQFIKENSITPAEKVSKNRPDFLNRAVLPIVLERYQNNNKKISDEAFEILKEFILSRKGIPHKSDLIYQELRGNFSDDKKWKLVKVSIDKYKIPVNPFVEEIALELAKRGHKAARRVLKDWIKNPDYYQRGIFERNVTINISQFLDVSFGEGVKMFNDFINMDYFSKGLDNFHAFEVARLLNKIINENFNIGIKILKTLSRKSELTDNEQILLCSSLISRGDSKQEDEKILMKIYNSFLNPFLSNLDNNIKKIEAKITRPQSRSAIVEFADVLVGHQKIDKAIKIISIFTNDSDPCTPEKIDPQDLKGEYDEHKRIEQGEDTHAITTVRGQCAWSLMNCAGIAGRDYIEEIINLTENLTRDKNYYVQLMSCYPLSQLARNRLTVMSENREELFFNKDKEKALKMAKRVEKITFRLLRKFSKLEPKSRDVLTKALLRVFDHNRALNQRDAKDLLEKIFKCGEGVVSEAPPLFIYFAEFRQKDFKNWKWQMPGLYDDLEIFDNMEFQEILENILRRNNSKINSQFAWHFWKFVKESVPDKADIKNVVKYSEAFEISNRYLNVLVENYDHQTFKNVYYFIQENIGKRFEECYKLWQKCLKKERPIIKKLVEEGKVYEASWWPFYHNDGILTIIKQKSGDEEFLNSLEFLLDYPKEANIGDISKVVEILQILPNIYNQQIEKIFGKLIDRNIAFYNTKEAWKKSKKLQ